MDAKAIGLNVNFKRPFMKIGHGLIKLFSLKEKRWAGGIVFIIELILITPLCGLIFQCGCDWPWFGLDEKCNFYQPHIKHQCPWCVSMLTGGFSLVIAMITGIYVSTLCCLSLSKKSIYKDFIVSPWEG